MKRSLAVAVLVLLPACSFAQSNAYSQWANYPQDPNFFPIAIWLQGPDGGTNSGFVGGYANNAAAAKGLKINTWLAIDGGNGGGGWPRAFGQDCGASTCGQFALLVSNGIYVIPNVDYMSNTSATSVASVEAIATAQNASQYLIGYNLGDEPICSVAASFPTYVANVTSYDSTRPTFWNLLDWVFPHMFCGSTSSMASKTIGVASQDTYPALSPWNGAAAIPFVTGQPQDSLWIDAWSVSQAVTLGRPNQPVWMFINPVDDAFGYAQSNGSTCNQTTNLCGPDNHQFRTSPEIVNADAWATVINGGLGIEWFCHDISLTGQVSYNYCLGATRDASGNPLQTADAATAASSAATISYVNTSLLNFAAPINSPTLGRVTQNTGTCYSPSVSHSSCAGDYTSSPVTNGILTIATSNSSVPGSAIVKNYNGTLYLFADSDRNGSATLTFTLTGYAGATATVVYDSNAQYDPAHSSIGAKFTLDTNGRFSDTFGANGHNYQPKIYKITSGGPPAPTGLTATVN